MELEYYSNCCTAPPIGELWHEEKFDAEPIGMCMKCRDNALFEILDEEALKWLEQHQG